MAEGFDFNAKPKERTPFLLTRAGGSFALFLLVFLSHAWMATLEFQLDDYEQVYEAAHPESPAVLLGADTPEQSVLRGHPTMVRFFRPLLHLSFVIDHRLFGADPRAYHLSSVFWHAVTVVLLYLVLRSLLAWRSPATALACAAVFALHPGKNGAVSWIAARGDVLMTAAFLAALGCLMRTRRRPEKLAAAGVIFFLLTALGAKEGAVTAPIVLLLIDLAILRRLGTPQSIGRTLRFGLIYASLAPLYLIARKVAFGPAADFYAGEHRIWTVEILGRMLGDFLPAFTKLIGGYFHHDPGTIGARLQSFAASALGIALAVWASRRPILRTQTIVLVLLAYGLAVIPALRFFAEASGFDGSRVFYFPALFTSILVALPLAGFGSRIGLVRTATIVYAAIMAATLGFGGFTHARAQWSAAELIRRVQSDLKAVASTTPRADVWYVLLDVPTDVLHAPTFGTFLTYAFMSPFVEHPIVAKGVIDEDVFFGTGELYAAPAPIRILRWQKAERRLVPDTAILLEPTGNVTEATLDPATLSASFENRMRPRDVRTMTLEFAGPLPSFRATLRLADDDGAAFDIPIDWDAQWAAGAKAIRIPVTENRLFLHRAPIRRVALLDASAPLPSPVQFTTRPPLPELTLTAPDEGAPLAASAKEPVFFFRADSELSRFRWTVWAGRTRLTWTLPRTALIAGPDGTLGFAASMKGEGPGEAAHYWGDLRSAGSILDQRGVSDMPLTWKIEGFTGSLTHAAASSRSRTARIVR